MEKSAASVYHDRQFRKILKQEISDQLEKRDLQTMMNMVAGVDGFPGFAEIEEVKSGFEFFMMLIKREKLAVNNLDELLELLDCVQRQDLKKKLCDSVKALLNCSPKPSSPNRTDPSKTNTGSTSSTASNSPSPMPQDTLKPSSPNQDGQSKTNSETTYAVPSPSKPMQKDQSVRPKDNFTKSSTSPQNIQKGIHSKSKPTVNTACGDTQKTKSSPQKLDGTPEPKSPPLQNPQQDLSHSPVLGSSKGEELSGDYQSLKSNPPSVENKQQQTVKLKSISDESAPDPSDMGGPIEISAGSSLSPDSKMEHTSPVQRSPTLHSDMSKRSDMSPENLQRKMADLSLDGSSLETDAPGDASEDTAGMMVSEAEQEEFVLAEEDDDAAAGEPSGYDQVPDQPQPERPAPKQLRAYQKELATPPLSGHNFIICAPTGSGKTLIAAHICQQLYQEADANKRYFKALFIVNIRHLTNQQCKEFKDHFPKGKVWMIGETEQLKDIFHKDGVSVVMVTAQIVVNALNKRDLSMQDISIMFFDECHHTTKNHAYNEIMKRYLKKKRIKMGLQRVVGESGSRLPHIIGLSASLGVGSGNAFDHVQTLCGNMDAENVLQVHENKEELKKYVNAPENDKVRYVSSRNADQRDLGHIIEGIMSEIESEIRGEDGVPFEHGTQQYEQWIRKVQNDAESSTDQREKYIASMYLFEYNKALMIFEDLSSSTSFEYLQDFMRHRDLEQSLVSMEDRCRSLFESETVEMKRISRMENSAGNFNPKLEELTNLLTEIFTTKPDSMGIILCRTRLATAALKKFLHDVPALQDLENPVRSVRLVGQGDSDQYFMTESEQKKSLKAFKEDHSYNLLIATDIAQEGLDMPACNFVIRFNFVSNEIGTVQSKGRARAKQSQCYLIVEEDSINAKREAGNRHKVKDMLRAMDKLNQLPEDERLEKIKQKQEKSYKKLDEEENRKAAKGNYHALDSVQMLCKECNSYITKASYMMKKGCNYTCTDPDIKQRIIVAPYTKADQYRDTETVGVFKCANPTCGQKLGIAVNFLDDEIGDLEGYGFGVKSFRFKFTAGNVKPEAKTYKQWQKVPISIPEDTDTDTD